MSAETKIEATRARLEREFLRAEGWRGRGFLSRAAKLYASVLSGFDPGTDPGLWLEASLGAASCLRALGDAQGALARLGRASALARRCGIFRDFGRRLALERALGLRAAGLWSRCLRELAALLRSSRRRGDRAESAFILWAMGGALRFAGRLAESEQALRRSLALAGGAEARGYALFGLAGVLRVRGRLAKSARCYARAGRLFARGEDLFARAYAQCGLANALRQLGRLREAERRYLASRKLYARIEDGPDLGFVEWGLGKVYLQQGRLGPAHARLEGALALFRRHGETRGEALSLIALAQCLHALGRTRRAEALFARGLRRSRGAGLSCHLEVFT